MNRIFLILILMLFLALTGVALWGHGYVGLFKFQLSSYAGMQVLADLVIALGLFILWVWQDSKKSKRNPWPWVLATIMTGSVAPLVYLLVYKSGSDTTSS